MSPVYRVDLIPRWIWVLLAVALLLVLIVAISAAASRGQRQAFVPGPEVTTGNPQDFMEQPPTPAVPPTTTEPETVTPTTPGTPGTGQIPQGLPEAFTFQGRTWQFAEGPVQVEVVTTGEYADDHIIYQRQNRQPPFQELFLETEPNSGIFYKYIPAKPAETVSP